MPAAVKWYRAFCWLFAAFNVILTAICVWFIVSHDALANAAVTSRTILIAGLACAPIALAIAVFNVWIMFSRSPKNPWQMHLSNICAGTMTCFLAPMAILLLLAWFKPEVKAYYEAN